jgi:hypothetical protein
VLNTKFDSPDTAYTGYGKTMSLAYGLQYSFYSHGVFSVYWFGDARFTFSESEKKVFTPQGLIAEEKTHYPTLGVIGGIGVEIVLLDDFVIFVEGGATMGLSYHETFGTDHTLATSFTRDKEFSGTFGTVPINMLGVGFRF